MHLAECEDCGYSKEFKSEARAAFCLSQHSCERQRMLADRAAKVQARINADGPKAKCSHKYANHQHGTRLMYVLDKCHCRACREANTAERRRVAKLQAFGRYDSGRVDAQPVREHIRMLMDFGIGLKRIAEVAGVSNSTVGRVIYGDHARNMPPRARVERHVHDAVLAVQPTLENLGCTTVVDGTGTRRRLQSLMFIGYSMSYLGSRIGMTPGNFSRTVKSDRVQAETARAVAALYLELENRPRVGSDQHSRISVSRAHGHALRQGWLPPAAWDEDTIDDPDFMPERKVARDHAVVEDVEFLLKTGTGRDEIAARLGRPWGSISDGLRRAGRADLVAMAKTDIRNFERTTGHRTVRAS